MLYIRSNVLKLLLKNVKCKSQRSSFFFFSNGANDSSRQVDLLFFFI